MRKGNMTILASVFIIASMMFSLGLGTMAYFGDVETSDIGQIRAGTMDLLIATGNEYGKIGPWKNGDTIDITGPQNWEPGETFTIYLWFKNIGSIDAKYMYRKYYGYTFGPGLTPESEILGDNDIGQMVNFVVLTEFYKGTWYPTNWITAHSHEDYDQYVDGSDAFPAWSWVTRKGDDKWPLTLVEVVDSLPIEDWHEKCYVYESVMVDGEPVEDYMPKGSIVGMKLVIEFDKDADNRFQGDEFSFKIDVRISNYEIPWTIGPADEP